VFPVARSAIRLLRHGHVDGVSQLLYLTFSNIAILIHKSSVLIPCIHNVHEISLYFVRFEVSMEVTMKNSFFWDVTPCGSCKNRRFGGT
jgi:hypothetical protein